MRRDKLHPLLTRPIEVSSGVAGVERPGALLDIVPDRGEVLYELANTHIVSARQFNHDLLVQLCRLGATFEAKPALMHQPLAGKILITAFYEPSTRTRASFESAWHRLGGDIISITDPATTGIAKGESLGDVAEMFSNYGDIMVLRDNREDSIYNMLDRLRIPIINAGNGVDEHPTQALADLYTILKWRPDLAMPGALSGPKIRLGIIGTPNRMRTVRSLLMLLTLISYAIEEVVVINPMDNVFDFDQIKELEGGGLNLRRESYIKDVLPELDVVYINSIAWVGDTFEKLNGDLELSAASPLKSDAIILHPLARGEELDESLDTTPHNWYFAQARGAVFLRMALLTCLVQRIQRVADVAPPPPTEDGNGNGNGHKE